MGQVILGGFALGGTKQVIDANGCSWITESLTGWGDVDTTVQLSQKSGADGAWTSESYRTPRTVTAVSSVVGPTTAAVAASLDLFYATCLGTPTLSVDDGQGPRTTTVVKQYAAVPSWTSDVSCDLSWQMEAPDPRKLGVTLLGNTGLPSSSGGTTLPLLVPFSINSTMVTGQVNLTNPGNASGPVLLRITGPVTGPVITHVSSGAQLVFSSSLVLNPGEFLLVDMDNRSVLAQGQASRSAYVTSRGWSSFDPGPNTWAFTAQSGTGQLAVTATQAWL